MNRTHRFVLYVAIPLLVAILMGLRAQLLEEHLSLLFWTIHVVPIWMLSGVACLLLHKLLRPWTPPLWVIALLGAAIADVGSIGYTRMVFLATGDLFHGINDPARYTPIGFTREFGSFFLHMYLGGILLWTAVNYFYDRVIGIPRYRYPDQGRAEVQAPLAGDDAAVGNQGVAATGSQAKIMLSAERPELTIPPFLARVCAELGMDLLALQAQEHYIKVYTTVGNTLVLYRFIDAVAELRSWPGLRVHRSYWVMRKAIVGVRPRGKSSSIELVNGLTIPVSLSYKGVLEGLDVRRLPATSAPVGASSAD